MSSLPVSDTISNRIWLKNTAGNFRQCFFVFICGGSSSVSTLLSNCAIIRSCPCFLSKFILICSCRISYSTFPFLAHFPTFPRPFPLSNSFLSLSLTTLSLRHPHPPLSLPCSLTTLSLPFPLFNFVIAVLDTAITSLYYHGHSQGDANGTNQHPVF